MKKRNLLLIVCLLVLTQTPLRAQEDRKVNFGIKGGFTSSLFLVSNFSVNGVAIDEVQNRYKIGYFASFFTRINFNRHFFQPELSYSINRCAIEFDLSSASSASDGEAKGAAGSRQSSINSTIHSLDLPLIYGYNFIKESPYSLAVFGGPKLRYVLNNSKISFENFEQSGIEEKLNPLNLSFTLGVAVNISRIFFDFRYDIGLTDLSREVHYEKAAATDSQSHTGEINFNRRDNVLSFSLGVFF